jgi:hypothetical protein
MDQESSLDCTVRVAEEQALARLTELAAGRSMCVVGRSGQSFPAAKYHEGAVAALSDLRRALASGGDPSTTLATVRERWTERSRASTLGEDWAAYNAGARDALAGIPGSSTPLTTGSTHR